MISVNVRYELPLIKTPYHHEAPVNAMAGALNVHMTILDIDINQIIPYAQNAKKHPAEQVDRIANSIREFGFRQPLVIDKDNVLVIGHGRLEAAKRLGYDTVPCVRADDLTEDQIKALRLADNKTNESDWDVDFLDLELDDITDIDMSQFGFDVFNPDDFGTEFTLEGGGKVRDMSNDLYFA